MKDTTKKGKKDLAFLKQMAEEYSFTDIENIAPPRHWADLPGGIKVCFTKVDIENNGCFRYHLSISAVYGRVSDLIAIAIMNELSAPSEVTETPPMSNLNVRHFRWAGNINILSLN